jgi:hypothetical protein
VVRRHYERSGAGVQFGVLREMLCHPVDGLFILLPRRSSKPRVLQQHFEQAQIARLLAQGQGHQALHHIGTPFVRGAGAAKPIGQRSRVAVCQLERCPPRVALDPQQCDWPWLGESPEAPAQTQRQFARQVPRGH